MINERKLKAVKTIKYKKMLKRRNFLKQTGAAALGGLLLPNKSMAAFFNKPAPHPLGVQLFT